MKRQVVSLIILAAALACVPASADSINLNTNGGSSYFYNYPGLYNELEMSHYAPTSNGYNYLYSYVYNCCYGSNYSNTKFQYGWLDAEKYNGKTNSWSYVDGSLFNGVFNSKTDTLKASFSGWWEAYGKNGWADGYFTGTYIQHFNSNGTLAGGFIEGAPAGTGLSPVPEPSTLGLMGTGLVGLAFRIRKKFAKQ